MRRRSIKTRAAFDRRLVKHAGLLNACYKSLRAKRVHQGNSAKPEWAPTDRLSAVWPAHVDALRHPTGLLSWTPVRALLLCAGPRHH
jgi:hypothetical protein